MRSNVQIDGLFGAVAGLGEMLLQSQAEEMALLPALPAAWNTGEANGLRARGGFEVAMRWREGKLSHAEIRSELGRTCRVRTQGRAVVMANGKEIAAREVSAGVIEFPTVAGGRYELDVPPDRKG
jgi:alpha-L-fucosidase 2